MFQNEIWKFPIFFLYGNFFIQGQKLKKKVLRFSAQLCLIMKIFTTKIVDHKWIYNRCIYTLFSRSHRFWDETSLKSCRSCYRHNMHKNSTYVYTSSILICYICWNIFQPVSVKQNWKIFFQNKFFRIYNSILISRKSRIKKS